MAMTSASQGASGTAAADLWTTLSGLMTAAGWTFVEQATAVQAGTDAGTNIPVEVWKNAGSTCVVMVEVDDTLHHLRFRCSEKYTAGADHKLQYPCPGTSYSASITPKFDDSIDSGLLTIFQATGGASKVGWVDIPVSNGGFNLVAGANANEIVLATSTSPYNWVHAGHVASPYNLSPDSSLVFLGGCAATSAVCISWVAPAGNYRVSREPNQGAFALTGAFCYLADGVSSVSDDLNAGAGGQPGATHKWLAAMAAYPAYLHGVHQQGTEARIRSHLAKLTSMAVAGHDTLSVIESLTTVGDTITIDGDVYYALGPTHLVASSPWAIQAKIMLAKSAAF